jgi:acetyl-CoA synthetase
MADPMRGSVERWERAATTLDWDHPPATTLGAPRASGHPTWFPDGHLNLAVNAVHRHVGTRGGSVALHWEGEPGDRRSITYAQLHHEVVALADALSGLGIRAGDRVALHLGLLPEAVVALLACAHLGVTASVLPAVLPPDALSDRLSDLRPRVLVTQDGAWRHGVVLPLKQRADEALTAATDVEHTIVVRRTGIPVPWYDGDRWYDELVAAPRPGVATSHTPPVPVPSDHPSVITYLANRGGRPQGVVHGTGGFATYCVEMQRTLSTPEAVVWVPAELGWLASQSHGLLGPLLAGATAVAYEGMLDTPTHRRAWEIIARYAVGTLLATPSVVRALRSWVGNAPTPEEVASLDRVVTAGEAIDASTDRWLRRALGHDRATVVNAWGQTELGGVVAVPADPAIGETPDAGLRVEDAAGDPRPVGTTGDLVLRLPWPGTALGVLAGDDVDPSVPRFRDGALVTGDLARRREDGSIELLGRSDRVFSVSGQLVSATEIKLALEEHPFVTRAEVVDRPDPSTGRAVVAVVQTAEVAGDEALALELQVHVHDLLGGLSHPRNVLFVERFPTSEDAEGLVPALRALATTGPVVRHVTEAQLAAALRSVRQP